MQNKREWVKWCVKDPHRRIQCSLKKVSSFVVKSLEIDCYLGSDPASTTYIRWATLGKSLYLPESQFIDLKRGNKSHHSFTGLLRDSNYPMEKTWVQLIPGPYMHLSLLSWKNNTEEQAWEGEPEASWALLWTLPCYLTRIMWREPHLGLAFTCSRRCPMSWVSYIHCPILTSPQPHDNWVKHHPYFTDEETVSQSGGWLAQSSRA